MKITRNATYSGCDKIIIFIAYWLIWSTTTVGSPMSAPTDQQSCGRDQPHSQTGLRSTPSFHSSLLCQLYTNKQLFNRFLGYLIEFGAHCCPTYWMANRCMWLRSAIGCSCKAVPVKLHRSKVEPRLSRISALFIWSPLRSLSRDSVQIVSSFCSNFMKY